MKVLHTNFHGSCQFSRCSHASCQSATISTRCWETAEQPIDFEECVRLNGGVWVLIKNKHPHVALSILKQPRNRQIFMGW